MKTLASKWNSWKFWSPTESSVKWLRNASNWEKKSHLLPKRPSKRVHVQKDLVKWHTHNRDDKFDENNPPSKNTKIMVLNVSGGQVANGSLNSIWKKYGRSICTTNHHPKHFKGKKITFLPWRPSGAEVLHDIGNLRQEESWWILSYFKSWVCHHGRDSMALRLLSSSQFLIILHLESYQGELPWKSSISSWTSNRYRTQSLEGRPQSPRSYLIKSLPWNNVYFDEWSCASTQQLEVLVELLFDPSKWMVPRYWPSSNGWPPRLAAYTSGHIISTSQVNFNFFFKRNFLDPVGRI